MIRRAYAPLEQLIADAGNGSEENYEFLESEGSSAFAKYNTFHHGQKRSYKTDPLIVGKWH